MGAVSTRSLSDLERGLGRGLERAGVATLARAMAAGELSSDDLVRAYLARITALDGRLNAVREVNPSAETDAAALDAERRAGQVRGPLHGIPVLVKNNIDVAGLATSAGSLALAGSVPDRDAGVVAQLREAGVVVLGTTNLTEMANYMSHDMPSGYSALGGQVINPYDASRTPSGSSAGSAAAAAAAFATLTVGTETSGSILSPAQACSVVGVKPTVGLVSGTGILPIATTQDTAGPMGRTVRDVALLLSAMAPPSASTDYTADLGGSALDGARLGLVGETTEDSPFARAVQVLRDRGATVVPVRLAPVRTPDILTFELRRDLNAYLALLPARAPVHTLAEVIAHNEAHPGATLKFGQSLLQACEAVDLDDEQTAATYVQHREQGLREAREAISSVLTEHRLDALVSTDATIEVAARAGCPSVSVPAGYTTHGREPVALVFTGTAFTEARLLALAHDYEQAAQVWRPPSTINPSLFR